jgi:hypothetical protein
MMADDVYALVETPRFSLRRVVTDTFETFGRSFLRLLAIVLILGVPLFVWLILGGEKMLLRFAATAEGSGSGFDPAALMTGGLLWLIGLAIHAAVTDAAFQDLLGEEGDLLQSLARALVVAPVLIAVGFFVAIVFGMAVFMIALASGLITRVIHFSFGLAFLGGGLFGLAALMVQWWVAIPAIVVEGAGPIECFRRSARLVAGSRWKVFALVTIVYLPEIAVSIILLLMTEAVGPVVVAVLNIILSGLFITFNTVMTVMIYGHLRAI